MQGASRRRRGARRGYSEGDRRSTAADDRKSSRPKQNYTAWSGRVPDHPVEAFGDVRGRAITARSPRERVAQQLARGLGGGGGRRGRRAARARRPQRRDGAFGVERERRDLRGNQDSTWCAGETATPRVPREYSAEMGRGDAAAATWIFRGDGLRGEGSRHRRGYHADRPRPSRGDRGCRAGSSETGSRHRRGCHADSPRPDRGAAGATRIV